MSFLEKIFISYSSEDKSFVQRLSKLIEEDGFNIWLDERSLVPGDPLADKISEAILKARVVLVIISSSSISSKWLKYELNIATERMIKGECRIVPVVIDNTKLPHEVQGLLYADCRFSLESGWKGIQRALKYEEEKSILEKGFWAIIPKLIKEIFEGTGFGSVDGPFTSVHFETCYLSAKDEYDDSYSVAYEVVSSYRSPPDPLTNEWWDDYKNSTDILPEVFHLLVSERPISFSPDYWVNPFVGVRSEWIKAGIHTILLRHDVILDLSNKILGNEKENLIEARRILEDLADEFTKFKKMKSG